MLVIVYLRSVRKRCNYGNEMRLPAKLPSRYADIQASLSRLSLSTNNQQKISISPLNLITGSRGHNYESAHCRYMVGRIFLQQNPRPAWHISYCSYPSTETPASRLSALEASLILRVLQSE